MIIIVIACGPTVVPFQLGGIVSLFIDDQEEVGEREGMCVRVLEGEAMDGERGGG